MKRALRKDTLREIKRTFSRFVSILAIVALGAGFFSGVKATGPNMKRTGEQYFRDSQLMDLRLVSTMGFSEEDVQALSRVQGVSKVEPGYTLDAILSGDEARPVVRLHALAPNWRWDPQDSLNRVTLKEGRMPQREGECLAESGGFYANLKVGDSVTLVSDDGKSPLSDSLERDTYTVVGLVESPLYIGYQHGKSTIGNGNVSTFLMIPPENFKSDVYTQVYLTAENPDGISCFSQDYETLVEQLKDQVEAISGARIEARYQEVSAQAQEKLDDAKEQLRDGEAQQEEELSKARAQLEDARRQIREGEQAIQEGQHTLDTQKAQGQQQLDAAAQKLQDGWKAWKDNNETFTSTEPGTRKTLNETISNLTQAEKTLGENREKLQENRRQLQLLRQSLDKGWSDYNNGNVEINAAVKLLGNARQALQNPQGTDAQTVQKLTAGLSALHTQTGKDFSQAMQLLQQGQIPPQELTQRLQGELDALDASLKDAQEQQKDVYAELEKNETQYNLQLDALNDAQAQLDESALQVSAGLTQAKNGLSQLDSAKQELADSKKELEDAQAQLSRQQTLLKETTSSAQAQLDEKRTELEDAKTQLEDGERDYEEGKAESDRELEDARARIREAEEQIQNLEAPTWYYFTRDDNAGYSGFADDADRINSISKVFPVFFILVAALVSLTTMTRMVEEQRTQIGTLKALGYPKSAIVLKYLTYSSLASVIGSVLGLTLGMWLFPTVIFNAYRIMYRMPAILTPFHWDYAIACTVVAVAGTGLAALAACYSETMASPAVLMRPKSPKAGKRVLLERITPLWKRLNFIQKVTVRNLFRYKRKILMTVVGIAGCTALMLVGFGLKDSLTDITRKQFSSIFLYNTAAALEEGENTQEIAKTVQSFQELPEIDGVLPMVSENFTTVGKSRQDITVYVPKDPQQLSQFISLHERKSKRELTLQDSGGIITEKAAKLLDVGVGDTVTIRDADNREYAIPITGITENYASHFLYLSPEGYSSIFGKECSYSTLLCNLSPDATEDEAAQQILKQENILGVSSTSSLNKDFNDIIGTLNYVVLVLIISASALAFVVLYNLSNVNVNERIREIATIKVLGFYDREVTQYIFRENVILTVMGIAAGLVLGIFLHQFVIVTAEIDTAMFGRQIYPLSYILAALLTFLFAGVVNFALHFRLKKVSMVESLKSVE